MSMVTRKRAVSTKEDEEKSSFEKRREENLKANAKFLENLRMDEVKTSLKTKTLVKRSYKLAKNNKSRDEDVVPRKFSLRLRTRIQSASIPDDPMCKMLRSGPITTRRETTPVEAGESYSYQGQLTEPVIAWTDCLTNDATDMSCLRTSSQHPEKDMKISVGGNLSEFLHTCKSMVIDENLIAKVTPKRIFSVDIHPAVSNCPLVVAGDTWGRVGLWNVKQEDGICLFKPHTRPVNCSLFSRYNHHLLHTSSYDGTVRTCDINKQSFTLAYGGEDNVQHMYMSEIDEHRVAVASSDGSVTYLDLRTNQPCAYNLNAGNLKSISHHPLKKNYFITGSIRGFVNLWDDRKIDSECPTELVSLSSSRGVLSAFFSPLTGEKIVSCAADDRIRLYNSSELTSITLSKSIYHDNYTGRWLSNFRAQWHPSREDCFLIGSMARPRQVQLYDCGGYLLHKFCDEEHLRTVGCLNAFHPCMPVLAASDACGNVHVFMDKTSIAG